MSEISDREDLWTLVSSYIGNLGKRGDVDEARRVMLEADRWKIESKENVGV